MLTKNLTQDRIFLIVLAIVYLVMFLLDIGNKVFTIPSISMTSIGLALFPIMYLIYPKAVKNSYVNILYLFLHCYIISSIKLRKIFEEQP